MSRVRILGPREALPEVLEAVQDIGLMHITESAESSQLLRRSPDRREQRRLRRVQRIVDNVETAGRLLREQPERTRPAQPMSLPDAALFAGRTRRALEALEERRQRLEEERALILKFQPFFPVFDEIASSGLDLHGVRIFYLLLRGDGEHEVPRVRKALRASLGEEFQLFMQPATSGPAAMILVVSASAGKRVEALLTDAGVDPLSLPEEFEGTGATGTIRQMQSRHREIPAEFDRIESERRRIARERGGALLGVEASLRDHLAVLSAINKASVTPRAFVLEGWTPRTARADLENGLARTFGDVVQVEEIASEDWEGEPTPVVLRNPRLFRPFEAITTMMPLPHYGSIDPTPFVAVFFPMFFGVALGDIGYGVMLAVVSSVIRFRSKPDGKLRAVSEIGLACSLFTMIFGFLYGEFFGDLGHRFGLHPIIFSREEAVIPFLGFALALGLVHIVVGLCLGAVKMFQGDRKAAVGRVMAAVMVILIALTLLAAFELLPSRFFTPLVIAVLVAFPILVIAEGILAPIEFISTLGNVLSYARIMAVGTASVMMAVVANRMAGAFGGVVVGVLFALLFHLINFVIGVFSPTIHMLRLHYVEFFGKFFSPGGIEYEPFRHWAPREGAV